MSIQCPLEQTIGCFWTSNGLAATLTPDYALLPGVLYGYKVGAADLAGYIAPFGVPEPGTFLLLSSGLAGLFGWRRKRRTG